MVEREKCCGCSACYNVCPNNCIIMEPDNLGFLYPIINEDYCVHCNLCEKVCPSLHEKEKEKYPCSAWGGYVADENLRLASSSGGMFSLFAKQVIDEGGIVFGAALTDDCKKVQHIMVNSIEDLARLRGSKYVQSDIGNTYKEAKAALLSGQKVIFSGTPCQIEGLNLFLQKEYDNLTTIEVICHGTPSPRLFEKYINFMEKKLGSVIRHVFFRDEVGGNLIMRIETENGTLYRKDKFRDLYFRMFLSDTCLRESCYDCPSRGFAKRADITLSDFWGVEDIAPDLVDGGGISLVIRHTPKGERAFNAIKDNCVGREVDVNDALKGNGAFFESYKRPALRNTIDKDIKKLDFPKIVWKYAYSKREKILAIIKKIWH